MTFFSKLKKLICSKNNLPNGELLEQNEKTVKGDNPELLIHANSEIEASIIESKLKAYGIPVLKEYDGSGLYSSVITGTAVLGAEIYVPSSLLESAKDLITQQSEPEGEI